MKTIFDDELWSASEAALNIICNHRLMAVSEGTQRSAQAMRAWLDNPTDTTAPVSGEQLQRHMERFAQAGMRNFGERFATIRMHPAVWAWFAAAKLWRTTPQKFWRDYYSWAAAQLIDGRMPLIQRRSSAMDGWTQPQFVEGVASPEIGVPATTFIFYPFERRQCEMQWRTVFHQISGGLGVPSVKPGLQEDGKFSMHGRGRHISDSRGCQKRLQVLLPEVCDLNDRTVRRVDAALADGPPYEAPTLYQDELAILIAQVEGSDALADYCDSTIWKALSKVVSCRRGRRVGTTKTTAKRTPEAATVRE